MRVPELQPGVLCKAIFHVTHGTLTSELSQTFGKGEFWIGNTLVMSVEGEAVAVRRALGNQLLAVNVGEET